MFRHFGHTLSQCVTCVMGVRGCEPTHREAKHSGNAQSVRALGATRLLGATSPLLGATSPLLGATSLLLGATSLLLGAPRAVQSPPLGSVHRPRSNSNERSRKR